MGFLEKKTDLINGSGLVRWQMVHKKFCVDDFLPNLRLSVMWSELHLSVLIRLLEICNFRLVLDSVRAAIETCGKRYQVRDQFGTDRMLLVCDGGAYLVFPRRILTCKIRRF